MTESPVLNINNSVQMSHMEGEKNNIFVSTYL